MSALAIILQIMGGWLLADFLSGVLHWLEDRFGSEQWPLIGRHVIAPNRLHHRDPLVFTRASFFDRNWTTWAAVAFVGSILLWICGPSVWLVTAMIGGAMVSEVHCWAHNRRLAPRWAILLQKTGLLQSPAQHARHHVPPHTHSYCILTDWLNPVLDRVRFWSLLEKPIPARWIA